MECHTSEGRGVSSVDWKGGSVSDSSRSCWMREKGGKTYDGRVTLTDSEKVATDFLRTYGSSWEKGPEEEESETRVRVILEGSVETASNWTT
jgi:hypothetical protein